MTVLDSPRPMTAAPHRHARAKRRLPNWMAVIGWVIVAVLAIVAIMRQFAWDDSQPFAVLNSVTAFVYLPAWIVLLVALVGRRFYLALAALVIVAAQVAFMLPELTASEPIPNWAVKAPTIRVLDGNVLYQNPSMAGYAQQIRAQKPDLITLEESTTTDVEQLKADGALAGYPYTIQIKRLDPKAFLVASKYPISGANVVYGDGGSPFIVQGVVHLPTGALSLWVVHTVAPQDDTFSVLQSNLDELAHLVKSRGTGNLLIVGDFNATWGNKGFRTILDAGMTDGAAARGEPFDMTWSQTTGFLPPVVRIDHVLTGAGVAVTKISSGPGPGSDHRDLSASIALRHG
jgi:endonuclease/exonuclease/phosphatase (EEP) superfamily protein YafD